MTVSSLAARPTPTRALMLANTSFTASNAFDLAPQPTARGHALSGRVFMNPPLRGPTVFRLRHLPQNRDTRRKTGIARDDWQTKFDFIRAVGRAASAVVGVST